MMMNSFSLLRQQAGLALQDVASEFGASTEAVSQWESGQSKPPERILRTLDLLRSFLEPTAAVTKSPIPDSRTAAIKARSGTFTDNMKLPIHRWFRYSAGFSAEWCSA